MVEEEEETLVNLKTPNKRMEKPQLRSEKESKLMFQFLNILLFQVGRGEWLNLMLKMAWPL